MIGYVYCRLIFVLVKAVLARRVKETAAIVTRIRVYPNDLDSNFHLNNGRFLTLMDIGRFDLISRSNMLKVIMKRRWFPVLGGAVIRYRKPIDCFEVIDLRTRLLWWDEKWVYLEQIFEVGGELRAKGLVRAVFKEGRRVVPTNELFGAFGLAADSVGSKPDLINHWERLDAGLRETEAR